MKKFAFILLTLAAVTVFVLQPYYTPLAASEGTNELSPTTGNVTPKEAHSIVSENAGSGNFVILDVRTPEEFRSGHIKGALNLDFYSKDFRDKLNKLDKKKTYLTHCRSGRRSARTLEIMRELGFKRAYNMLGGIMGWQKEGYPVTGD